MLEVQTGPEEAYSHKDELSCVVIQRASRTARQEVVRRKKEPCRGGMNREAGEAIVESGGQVNEALRSDDGEQVGQLEAERAKK